MITKRALKERLHYNQETGIFTWIKPAFNKTQYIGKTCGSAGKDGYLFVKIDGKHYSLARLAWIYVHGSILNGIIDHKDHNIINNAIDNLRDVTIAENIQNQIKAPINNLSCGLLGVRRDAKRNTWNARIMTNGKRVSLGHFKNAQDAHEAYLKAKRQFHSTCMI